MLKCDRAGHHWCQPFAKTDLGIELLDIANARIAGRALQHGGFQRAECDTQGRQALIEQSPSEFHRLAIAKRAQAVADAGARLAGTYEAQPAWIWAGGVFGEDLHHIAVDQLGTQLDSFLIDPSAHCVIADVGMDRIGIVENRCTARHGADLAPGREDVYGIRKQIDLDVLDEFQ